MKKLFLDVSFSKIYIIVMSLVCFLILGGYFSYAMFTVSKEKSNAISIVTGNLTYELLVDGEESSSMTVSANSSKTFIITLNNPNNIAARFNFYYLNAVNAGTVMGYLEEDGVNVTPSEIGVNLEKSGTAASGQIYHIRVDNYDNEEITINLGVDVGLDYNDLSLPNDGYLFSEYVEANSPELDSNMIAVKYENSNWVKADVNNTNNDWYDYNELKYANAVTVSASTRESYLNADIGTVVNMNDIETMWVWIPRYSYTIGSENGTNYYGKQGKFLSSNPTLSLPGEIDIKFVNTSTTDRGTAKYVVSNKIQVNSWYTPDAFTFDGEELSGIWVGKFESSSSNPTATNGGGNVTNLDVMIKPNVISWRYIDVSNAFTVSQKMNDSGNRYGFSGNSDTHMMKNTEWAVVAYLSQSAYGKLGNSNFTGSNKEIYQNKSNSFITGCSYGSPSNGNTDYGCQYTYNIDTSGTGASTTGNIYGVYDMSGGAWEYVMGNYNDIIGNSGFSMMPESKYYNKYTSNTLTLACNGNDCLSHALSETNGWYGDVGNMISDAHPWLMRGGYLGSGNIGGIFRIECYGAGNVYVDYSFRLVIDMLNS